MHAYPVVYRHLSDWETVPGNPFHELRQVNQKAERIYWQTRKTSLGFGPWMVGRRALDVRDWSLSPSGGNDVLWSLPEQFIYAEDLHLMGPDVSQGEQCGEPGSVPNYSPPVYDDSTMVVNFWSDTSLMGEAPELWHMRFGWTFYSTGSDHTLPNLVTAGLLEPLADAGRYPHLAARFSLTVQRGYQRNRRLFDQPGGTWNNYTSAPLMSAGSQYFYKTDKADKPVAEPMVGYRGRGVELTLGALKTGNGGWLTLEPEYDTTQVHAGTTPNVVRFCSTWQRFENNDVVELTTVAGGKTPAARLYVERRSDGVRLEANVFDTNDYKQSRSRIINMVGGSGNTYRFVLEPDTMQPVFGVTDVRITRPASATFERGTANHNRSVTLNLQTMRVIQAATMGRITVLPNPACDDVTITYDLQAEHSRHVGAGTSASATVTICDIRGTTILRHNGPTADVLQIRTTGWSAGLYSVVATDGKTCKTATLLVWR